MMGPEKMTPGQLDQKQVQQRYGIRQRPTSVFERKTDLLYLVFFIIHVPIMFCVDLVPMYPESMRPDILVAVRSWYVDTYADKSFTEPTAWFTAYMWMEALYHVPLSIWAVGALIRDDPMVPVHLLIWGVQTFVTTMTCLVEAWSWTDRTTENKYDLTLLYGPYMALAGIVALDMFFRLKSRLEK